MSVEKRMIVAVIVSAVVIVVWNLVFMPPQPEPPAPDEEGEAGVEEETGQEAEPPAEGEEAVTVLPERPEEPISATAVQTVVVESPLYRVTLTNESGGSATSWVLKNYEASFNNELLDLVAPAEYVPEFEGKPLVPLATMLRRDGKYEWLSAFPVMETGAVSDGKVVFDEDGEARVGFTFNDPALGLVEKKLTFHDDSYLVDVEFNARLERSADKPLVIWGPGLGELLKREGEKLVSGREANGYILRKAGAQVQRANAPVGETGEPGEPFAGAEIEEILRWVGVENAYFMALAAGDQENKFFPIYRLTASKQMEGAEGQPTFYYPYIGYSPRDGRGAFRLYVGPKDLKVLENTAAGEFADVVQFGWFSFVSRPALWLLQQINGVTSNFGLSIILLTILINLLLLPLILKQRSSMVAMQRLQPQLKQIQAKYKVEKGDSIQSRQEKKRKLNEEVMALYKAEGVNPMGGCLPLLIQLPILLALFDMFRVAIELRKAPFIFWLDNLAAPDPFFVTPILMGIVMFASQKITPSPAADSGGATMKLLPFIFVFFFAGAPSGLVLYWLTSSLFQFGTQLAMNAVNPPAAAVPAKGAAQARGRKRAKKSRRN